MIESVMLFNNKEVEATECLGRNCFVNLFKINNPILIHKKASASLDHQSLVLGRQSLLLPPFRFAKLASS